MTQIPFRDYHLLKLLNEYESNELPLDLSICLYFRANKALGSKDRAHIADIVYELVRWRGLLDYLSESKRPSWENRFTIYSGRDLPSLINDESIPIHVRCSCPKLLFELLETTYGAEQARKLALASNTRAPVTVRTNALKTTRAELLELWKEKLSVFPSKETDLAIEFQQKCNFFTLEEFKNGLFEVQDAGSQKVAALVKAKPGDLVMDYCAGSGGKSLAIAPLMEGKGQIYLLDVRERALAEARQRLKRAGVQNSQVHHVESEALRPLKKKMDWVLVDAPCSGTGTLRRNPDMKWRFNKSTLPKLTGMQRNIFEKALSFMKPEGHIVYATCSILKMENEEQVEKMASTYELEVVGEPFQSLPEEGGMDGFFGVVFKKRKKG